MGLSQISYSVTPSPPPHRTALWGAGGPWIRIEHPPPVDIAPTWCAHYPPKICDISASLCASSAPFVCAEARGRATRGRGGARSGREGTRVAWMGATRAWVRLGPRDGEGWEEVADPETDSRLLTAWLDRRASPGQRWIAQETLVSVVAVDLMAQCHPLPNTTLCSASVSKQPRAPERSRPSRSGPQGSPWLQ